MNELNNDSLKSLKFGADGNGNKIKVNSSLKILKMV